MDSTIQSIYGVVIIAGFIIGLIMFFSPLIIISQLSRIKSHLEDINARGKLMNRDLDSVKNTVRDIGAELSKANDLTD